MAKREFERLMKMRKQAEHNSLKIVSSAFSILLTAFLVPACAVLNLPGANTDFASSQIARTADARLELLGLEDIDTVIKLNNRWLTEQFSTGMNAAIEAYKTYEIQKSKIKFSKQIILVEAEVTIKDQYENIIPASISGEIRLDFRSTHTAWTAYFDRLEINARDFSFEDRDYTDPTPELSGQLLKSLNADFSNALSKNGNNRIALNATPLGDVQVGADLPGFSISSARYTEPLGGVFITAGTAVMIDSSYTTVALDLTFLPNILNCPADITVSRAEFARDIESREPVEIVDEAQNADDIRYFFSEISGADRPMSIIHYWYANGQAVAVEELAVGKSERWRTWSSGSSGYVPGDQLEVLIVEKETGCILLSKGIRIAKTHTPADEISAALARHIFAEFQSDFNRRTAGFTINEDKPPIASIETRRSFFAETLQASIANLNVSAEFDQANMSVLQLAASVQPFISDDIICEQRSCPPIPVCKSNSSDCKRFRDTRDCSSCLFRNPLNNRCVSETIDPLCEASRNRQNARYDADRAACIRQAETLKQECDLRNAQADRSCQIEAGFADNACESIKTGIAALKPGVPLANINTAAKSRGRLSVNFSNLRIEGDLERLKLDMSLSSDWQMLGDINFRPVNIPRPLANCIADWTSPFLSRIANTPAVNNLQSKLDWNENALIANWSGFGLAMDTNPSPLESVLVGNPQLLANCKIGLTVSKVEQAIAGDDAGFYRGQFTLQIQPLPTKIHLAPASLVIGNRVLNARAKLSGEYVRYDIED